jgi:hypothetical protein
MHRRGVDGWLGGRRSCRERDRALCVASRARRATPKRCANTRARKAPLTRRERVAHASRPSRREQDMPGRAGPSYMAASRGCGELAGGTVRARAAPGLRAHAEATPGPGLRGRARPHRGRGRAPRAGKAGAGRRARAGTPRPRRAEST